MPTPCLHTGVHSVRLGLGLPPGIDTAPEQTGPDPVDVLAELSGVSAGALQALSAEDRNGLAILEASVARVVEASRQMVNNRTTSLAVKDPSTRRVVGLLTQGDIVRCCASKMTAEHMTLQTTSESLGVGGWDEPSDTHTSVRPVSWDVPVSEIMTPTKKVTPTHSAHE